jgi:hypothetical protein
MSWGKNSPPKVNATNPVLLGFNEPDRSDQANMTVEEAIALWPQLVQKSNRLGSPAVAEKADKVGGWLETFMSYKPKVDFIAIHWYAPPNSKSFLSHIDAVYAKYNLPIWVTEFAVADWAGKYPGGYDVELVKTFMKEACAGLDKRSFVENYTWKSRPTSDPKLGTSGLWNDDGSLTDLGKIYAN